MSKMAKVTAQILDGAGGVKNPLKNALDTHRY